MYKENYKRARFNIEFGPASLFERVAFKMKDVHQLYLKGEHFSLRNNERDIPEYVFEKLNNFNSDEWRLVTASVRTDRGKFVDSTWEFIYDDIRYWVTIGVGNYVKTIVIKETSGVEKCIKSGELYKFVEQVNRELMEQEYE